MKTGRVRTPVPPNVRNFRVQDNNGNELQPGTEEYRTQFRKIGKYKNTTLRQMTGEYNRFITFLTETNSEIWGPEIVKQLLAKQLPDETISTMLSDFVENRINLFAWWDTGKIVPLDTSTLDRVWNQVCGMLWMELGVKVASNPAFNGARETKKTIMKDAKQNFQLGNLVHQASPLSRAQVNLLLHSDTLNLYQPFPLYADFFVNFSLTCLPRIREELYNIKRGELIFKYDEKGNPLCMFYVPFSSLKCNQGDLASTSNRASFLFKRACCLPCPQEPKLCMFRLVSSVLSFTSAFSFSRHFIIFNFFVHFA